MIQVNFTVIRVSDKKIGEIIFVPPLVYRQYQCLQQLYSSAPGTRIKDETVQKEAANAGSW
jgi:hypothetical protein